MRKLVIAFAVMLILPLPLFAGVFDVTVNIDNSANPYTLNFSKVEDMINQVNTDEILTHFPSYNQNTSSASVDMNFRGVPVHVSFAANSTQLTLNIPAIAVFEQFQGSTRDASVDDLKDWFKKNGGDALTRLQHVLSAETATDPIAGNPTSLMSRMASMDYDQATGTDSVLEMNTGGKADINANMISVFAKYSNYSTNGIKSREYALPMAYTIRFNQSKNTLAIRIPVSMVDVDSSTAYNLGLGLALGYQATDDWKLTPVVNYGAVGSVDLGSVGQIVSGSLTSSYDFHISKYVLSLGNMAGYYKTIPFSYGDYNFDPDLHNTVLRNGLDFVIPVGKSTSFDTFITDTRYFGSKLYIDQYNEVGFSYGFAKQKTETTDKGVISYLRRARAGATYQFADNSHGFTVNFGYSF